MQFDWYFCKLMIILNMKHGFKIVFLFYFPEGGVVLTEMTHLNMPLVLAKLLKHFVIIHNVKLLERGCAKIPW